MADALATALAADTAYFMEVRQPGASPYLERNALLFLVVQIRRNHPFDLRHQRLFDGPIHLTLGNQALGSDR